MSSGATPFPPPFLSRSVRSTTWRNSESNKTKQGQQSFECFIVKVRPFRYSEGLVSLHRWRVRRSRPQVVAAAAHHSSLVTIPWMAQLPPAQQRTVRARQGGQGLPRRLLWVCLTAWSCSARLFQYFLEFTNLVSANHASSMFSALKTMVTYFRPHRELHLHLREGVERVRVGHVHGRDRGVLRRAGPAAHPRRGNGPAGRMCRGGVRMDGGFNSEQDAKTARMPRWQLSSGSPASP